MILYAKSSLELIVNNRIGKVGIRPGCRGRPKPRATLVRVRGATLARANPPRRISFRTGVSALQISCCLSVRLSVPSDRP